MNINKTIKALVFSVGILPIFAYGAASITGTALQGVNGLSAGDLAVAVVDTSGNPFNTAALATLADGADLTDSATYTGFEVLTTSTAVDFFGTILLDVNANNFDVNNQPIVTGDSFAILTFEGGSTTSTASTVYEIWSDGSWLIPADLATPAFGGVLAQKGSGATAGTTGTVVPEPSAFAMIAGCLSLAWVMIRRRG